MQKQLHLCRRLFVCACLLVLLVHAAALLAQTTNSATLTGVVVDPHGKVVPNAIIHLRGEGLSAKRTVTADADGHFSISGLPAGSYSVEASASGFTVFKRDGVKLAEGGTADLSLTLALRGNVEEVTVTADGFDSVAAQASPVKALLTERTPTAIITADYIQNYVSPVADYGELVQMVPGTFSLSSDGVGLGQSKTYFRGFPDGDYNIDFDGVPFYDTNSPTHHSWAFFPAQWIGGVNFDRSPGTAATVGPTPFGGSIHLLSRELPSQMTVRGNFAYGSWNTQLYDGEFDSGNIGRSNFVADVHQMTSDGYQTFNSNRRNAGSLKYMYRISPTATLTGFAGVIWLDSHTPNFNGATRAQIAQNGYNFLLTDNSNPTLYTDQKYNFYHVPTDFEYVSFKASPDPRWQVEIKPYTYSYYNGQHYANAVTLTEPYCSTQVTKKGVTSIPCAVDKLNSYRKYGGTSSFVGTFKPVTWRFGMWYEWASTNRYQVPSDPLNGWKDQTVVGCASNPCGNFHERFWTDTYQPWTELEFHVTKRLNVTAGIKLAAYNLKLNQYADDGKTVGNLGGKAYVRNGANYSSLLPSLDANYRITQNWSAYGQLSTGSIVPPSSVFDYNQTTANSHTGLPASIEALPKPSAATTYQAGTVVKFKRVSFDADYYHTKFQNAYSSTTDITTGNTENYLQPDSITKGVEGEVSLALYRGLTFYANATKGQATYTGKLYVNPTTSAIVAPNYPGAIAFTAPSGLWVAQTPKDTEALGLTYSGHGIDAGMFYKRIGDEWMDNGSYHNQVPVDPFGVANLYIGYTVHSHSVFDQTKIRLAINNLLDQHAITTVTPANGVVSPITSGVTNPFLGTTSISGSDVLNVQPGRSVMIAVTFAFSPKGRR